MDELRECRCGGKGQLIEHRLVEHPDYKYFTVGCNGECQRETDEFATQKEAIAAWNRRHSPKPEALTGWVSVDDRLPEDEALILAYHPNYLISSGRGHDVDRITIKFGWYCRGSALGITHWMPLPTKPETEETL